MRPVPFVLLFLLVALVSPSAFAQANDPGQVVSNEERLQDQTATGQWARSLETLDSLVRPGRNVTVTLATGEEVKGSLAEVSLTSITLLVDGERRDLAEADVWRVEARKPRWRTAMMGAGSGAGLGLWAGQGLWENIPLKATAITLAVAAVVGAVAGAKSASEFDLLFQRDGPADGHRVQLSPRLSRRGMGAAVSLTWR